MWRNHTYQEKKVDSGVPKYITCYSSGVSLRRSVYSRTTQQFFPGWSWGRGKYSSGNIRAIYFKRSRIFVHHMPNHTRPHRKNFLTSSGTKNCWRIKQKCCHQDLKSRIFWTTLRMQQHFASTKRYRVLHNSKWTRCLLEHWGYDSSNEHQVQSRRMVTIHRIFNA
jgi:hypothetical protein